MVIEKKKKKKKNEQKIDCPGIELNGKYFEIVQNVCYLSYTVEFKAVDSYIRRIMSRCIKFGYILNHSMNLKSYDGMMSISTQGIVHF